MGGWGLCKRPCVHVCSLQNEKKGGHSSSKLFLQAGRTSAALLPGLAWLPRRDDQCCWGAASLARRGSCLSALVITSVEHKSTTLLQLVTVAKRNREEFDLTQASASTEAAEVVRSPFCIRTSL